MKKKKQKDNPFDELIISLTNTFSNIENFNLMTDSPEGRNLFNFVSRRIASIQNIKSLYISSFLPAVNKINATWLNWMTTSHFKAFIIIDKEDMKEGYYEVIRLGYVHLFHSVESFYNELLEQANVLFRYSENEIKIEDYVKNRYSIDIKRHWKKSLPVSEKINWICNSVKHNDGYPKEDTMPYPYLYKGRYPIYKKIQIEKEEFSDDIKDANDLCINLMQIVFSLGMMKMMFHDESTIDDEMKIKLSEFDTKILPLVELFKKN